MNKSDFPEAKPFFATIKQTSRSPFDEAREIHFGFSSEDRFLEYLKHLEEEKIPFEVLKTSKTHRNGFEPEEQARLQ